MQNYLINCGDIFYNGKMYTMFYDEEKRERVFRQLIENQYYYVSDEEQIKLSNIYNNNRWHTNPPIKVQEPKEQQKSSKNKIRKFIVAGSLVVVTVVGSLVVANNLLVKNNDLIDDTPYVISITHNSDVRPSVEIKEEKVKEKPEVIEEIKEEQEIEVEESVVDKLMDAIAANPNLSQEEIDYLSDFRSFFEDYAHLLNDYERTIETIKTVTVTYTGLNRGSTFGDYSARENCIRIFGGANNFSELDNRPERRFALFHEFAHAIQFSNYDFGRSTTNINRGISEGITTLVTFEYFDNGSLIKTDYIRTQAILQVLLEVVNDPEIVINMWLNDEIDETINALIEVAGTRTEARQLIEQIGLLEDSERVMGQIRADFRELNLEQLRELVSRFESFNMEFKTELENYFIDTYGSNLDLTEREAATLFEDVQLFEFAEMTRDNSLGNVSRLLKFYYETLELEDDTLFNAYFEIIDTFPGKFCRIDSTLVAVQRPLINKNNMGEEETFIFHSPTSTDDSNSLPSRFYERNASEFLQRNTR